LTPPTKGRKKLRFFESLKNFRPSRIGLMERSKKRRAEEEGIVETIMTFPLAREKKATYVRGEKASTILSSRKRSQ